ncbi:radical SAM protein [Clostridium sp.]|uniref:radical SAM protein n=1 Tax=Clostridium sp. TaxID=1506 RepID=UPI002FC819F6
MYDMPLYRPPSEGNSLIIQVTLGCAHNKCTFCSMYKSKKFKIKPLEVIKREIDEFRNEYGSVDRIFLADGDALIIKMDTLREIMIYINEVFKECERITMYASPKSIIEKTEEELKELKSLKLKMVYMGLESGSAEILEDINKGATRDEIIKASKKIRASGILLSATVIAGVGGKKKSYIHAVETGKAISDISPDYASVLSLMIEPGTEMYNNIKSGKFETLNGIEILEEIKLMIQNIETTSKIIFRSNHASNYVSLKGELMEDRDRLIKDIDWCISNGFISKEDSRRL